MTRWILWTGIVGMGVAAIVVSERQKVDVPASPEELRHIGVVFEHAAHCHA